MTGNTVGEKKPKSGEGRGPAKSRKTPEEVAAEKASKEAARRKAAEEKAAKQEAKRKAGEVRAEARRKAAEAKAAKQEAKRKADEERAEARRNVLRPDAFLNALRSATSGESQIATLTDLAASLDRQLRPTFKDHWQKMLDAAGPLPEGVGSLLVSRGGRSTRVVFLLKDVVPSISAPTHSREATPPEVPSGTSLKDRVLAEFDRLNEQGGGRLYVSLSDLRSSVRGVSRGDFDAALNELRRDGILTLNPAEGRHETVPPHVLEAGILEQARLLVYVARRES